MIKYNIFMLTPNPPPWGMDEDLQNNLFYNLLQIFFKDVEKSLTFKMHYHNL